MASKITLNAKNLETLGAERLAELLIEISTGSAVVSCPRSAQPNQEQGLPSHQISRFCAWISCRSPSSPDIPHHRGCPKS